MSHQEMTMNKVSEQYLLECLSKWHNVLWYSPHEYVMSWNPLGVTKGEQSRGEQHYGSYEEQNGHPLLYIAWINKGLLISACMYLTQPPHINGQISTGAILRHTQLNISLAIVFEHVVKLQSKYIYCCDREQENCTTIILRNIITSGPLY